MIQRMPTEPPDEPEDGEPEDARRDDEPEDNRDIDTEAAWKRWGW